MSVVWGAHDGPPVGVPVVVYGVEVQVCDVKVDGSPTCLDCVVCRAHQGNGGQGVVSHKAVVGQPLVAGLVPGVHMERVRTVP